LTTVTTSDGAPVKAQAPPSADPIAAAISELDPE